VPAVEDHAFEHDAVSGISLAMIHPGQYKGT
jgi:hypothetical protein